MAWNEPNNPNRDPWNAGRRGGGPPDLDEMLKRLRARFAGRPGGPFPSGGVGLVGLALAALWLASGFYVVDEQERAAILRFGAYNRTTGPGLHWRLPWPAEQERKVNVTGVRSVTDKSDMLTRDENVVEVELTVQYRVASAQDYLFNVADPDMSLRQATKSSVREVIGANDMDLILASGRQTIADKTRQILQQRLDAYRAGLTVTEVNLQQVQPPEAVQGAFADAIKAGEDQKRLQDEAAGYAEDRLPKARGAAAREAAEAAAYRERVIATAEGETARFLQLLTEYKKAPRVTRERLYLDTMSEVLSNTSKVLIDVDKGGQVIYLPLEQLLKSGQNAGSGDAQPSMNAPAPRAGANPPEGRSRERGAR